MERHSWYTDAITLCTIPPCLESDCISITFQPSVNRWKNHLNHIIRVIQVVLDIPDKIS